MADRQEFKFVVDGLELDERQKEQIGVAIQQAALGVLSSLKAGLETPLILGHAALQLNPEWYGLWLINGRRGVEIGRKIEEMGFIGQ